MKAILRLLSMLLIFCSVSLTYSAEILFYTDDDFSNNNLSSQNVIQLFQSHAKKINIIAPQIYQADKNGFIVGAINPEVLTIAKKNQVKIMPLVINMGFNQSILHAFLSNQNAMHRAIKSLIMLCEKYAYYGIQFDFENININDKNLYSNFIKKAAEVFHKKGYAISVTIVPRTPLDAITNQYDEYMMTNWSGAYDEKALASYTNFITLMAYDRHTSFTTPGPIAPLNWVKQLIQTLIAEGIAPNKISLGIPTYSGLWSTGKMGQHYQGKAHQISYRDAIYFIQKNQLTPKWNPKSMSYFVIYTHQGKGLYQYLYLEDARSFAAKYALVKAFHLRGVSVWQLGDGDPLIWKTLQ